MKEAMLTLTIHKKTLEKILGGIEEREQEQKTKMKTILEQKIDIENRLKEIIDTIEFLKLNKELIDESNHHR